MIESLSFLLGLGFSLLVHLRAIRPAPYSPLKKTVYSIISTIGITGMVWLSGVLIAHFLRERWSVL
jgi:hypothetical protein